MFLASWEKDLSKRSLMIDDDVINLLYCKTSSSNGFENGNEFFGAKMVAFLKEKTYQNSYTPGNYCTTRLPYVP